jgi:hypothetical protein
VGATGAAPLPLEALARRTAAAELAMVVDSSGSTFGAPWTALCESARATLEAYRGPYRRVSLHVSPASHGEGCPDRTCAVAATADHGAISAALRARVPTGASPIHLALRDLHATLAGQAGCHRFVVLYTDGRVDDPDATLHELARLRAANVDVHVVGPPTGADTDFLNLLAGGGPVTVAPGAPILVPASALPALRAAPSDTP